MTVNPYLSVQALTRYIKKKFDADPHLRQVYVKGELSNVKHHSTGHLYFTLKDEESQIRAMMFRGSVNTLTFRPESGMKVFLTGDISLYEKTGQYQLYAKTMEPDGLGALFVAYEQLKKTLEKEGLFQSRWKQTIPSYPQAIGVVTASTGAAIQDIHTTISRRYPLATTYLYAASVQGKEAVPSIVQAIEQANKENRVDVLIVGRGGGSIEDLWAFNEELVARAIFSSRIPIISAVGHETDTTIADYVADFRAPTPTAAAEVAVPSQQELLGQIYQHKRFLYQLFSQRIKQERKQLQRLQSSYPLQYPERLYRPFLERLAEYEERKNRAMQQRILFSKQHLRELSQRLQAVNPNRLIDQQREQVKQLDQRLKQQINWQLTQAQQNFQFTLRTLEAVSPLHVMERGYAIVRKQVTQELVKNSTDVQPDQEIIVRLYDGEIRAVVQTVHPIKEGAD